jgi:hypothetical protein
MKNLIAFALCAFTLSCGAIRESRIIVVDPSPTQFEAIKADFQKRIDLFQCERNQVWLQGFHDSPNWWYEDPIDWEAVNRVCLFASDITDQARELQLPIGQPPHLPVFVLPPDKPTFFFREMQNNPRI